MKTSIIRLFSLISLSCVAALGSACIDDPQAREFGEVGIDVPRSLEGTDIDGEFRYDDKGEFVFDEHAQLRFDYFLTADGELTATELEAWVSDTVRATVTNEHQHAQIMDGWHDYLLFRAEVAAVLDDPASAKQLATVEQQLLVVLDEQLGATPFAVGERQRIQQGFALNRAYAITDIGAREAELTRLSAVDSQNFAQTRAGRLLAGRQAITQAAQSGADTEAIQALRVQHYDALEPGAATRLAALDQKRAAWTQRVDAFRAEREQLRVSFVGAPAQLVAALDTLEAQRFSPAERRRVQALDKLESSL